MKPYSIPAVVLAASLSVAALPSVAVVSVPDTVRDTGVVLSDLATSPRSAGGPASLSADDRAALRAAEQRDADLADVKAGFFLADHDVALVAGTVVVVVLIALLL